MYGTRTPLAAANLGVSTYKGFVPSSPSGCMCAHVCQAYPCCNRHRHFIDSRSTQLCRSIASEPCFGCVCSSSVLHCRRLLALLRGLGQGTVLSRPLKGRVAAQSPVACFFIHSLCPLCLSACLSLRLSFRMYGDVSLCACVCKNAFYE